MILHRADTMPSIAAKPCAHGPPSSLYLVAGAADAVVAALGLFLPCHLPTVSPAPHLRRRAENGQIRAFVDSVTAAATGAVAGAAVVLGRWAIVDLFTAALAVGTWLLLTRFRKVTEPVGILVAGVLV
jgi:chromate transporter